jgi:hypothetical protein
LTARSRASFAIVCRVLELELNFRRPFVGSF